MTPGTPWSTGTPFSSCPLTITTEQALKTTAAKVFMI
jgi:hypothetical protein